MFWILLAINCTRLCQADYAVAYATRAECFAEATKESEKIGFFDRKRFQCVAVDKQK